MESLRLLRNKKNKLKKMKTVKITKFLHFYFACASLTFSDRACDIRCREFLDGELSFLKNAPQKNGSAFNDKCFIPNSKQFCPEF